MKRPGEWLRCSVNALRCYLWSKHLSKRVVNQENSPSMIKSRSLQILQLTSQMLVHSSERSTQSFCSMSIKILRNHRFVCCQRSLVVVIRSLQWEILANLSTHGAVPLPALLAHLIRTFRSVKAQQARTFMSYLLPTEMINQFWHSQTRSRQVCAN